MNDRFILGIGSQKAGTSYLHDILNLHSEIEMSPQKELHFFDGIESARKMNPTFLTYLLSDNFYMRLWRKQFVSTIKRSIVGKKKKVNIRLLKFYFLGRTSKNISKYKTILESIKFGAKYSGEITPEYCLLPEELILEIKENFPEVKIILILRDPASRDWSSAKMNFLKSEEKQNSPEKFITQFLKRENPKSNYSGIIEKWSKYFGPENFYIGFLR